METLSRTVSNNLDNWVIESNRGLIRNNITDTTLLLLEMELTLHRKNSLHVIKDLKWFVRPDDKD